MARYSHSYSLCHLSIRLFFYVLCGANSSTRAHIHILFHSNWNKLIANIMKWFGKRLSLFSIPAIQLMASGLGCHWIICIYIQFEQQQIKAFSQFHSPNVKRRTKFLVYKQYQNVNSIFKFKFNFHLNCLIVQKWCVDDDVSLLTDLQMNHNSKSNK